MKTAVLFGAAALALAAAAGAEEAKKIQDNSFLLEEAYNQEDGVVQHIQAFQRLKNRTWGYSFTEEVPVPKQAHQASITVPVSKPGADSGLGDILLNYRYQLVFKEKEGIAFAPRLSAVLPTGDHKKGLGSGALGMQATLPLSLELSDTWVTHWNLGATYLPGSRAASGEKADTLGFNYGFSLIWLLSENVNFMLETAGNASGSVRPDGTTERSDSLFINPGVRFAINTKSGLQIVPGIAFPIGVGPSKAQSGIFTYLSFEHPLF